MIRKIVSIDEEKCNGCGLCATACHEGAIEIVNGKARLIKDDYCDGLGDCLPKCPTGAVSIIEREAPAYDEEAVKKRKEDKTQAFACPGAQTKAFVREKTEERKPAASRSQLLQWPVQIKLMPLTAPYYEGAELLLAADCTAFAYAALHDDFMKGRITLIGCPKLDMVDYAEKLAGIFQANSIRSVTVVRMEVPCCGGLTNAVKRAIAACGKDIPCKVFTISTDGKIL